MATRKKKKATNRVGLNFKVATGVSDLLDRLQSRLDTSKTSVFKRSLVLLERCLDTVDAGGLVTFEDKKGKRATIEFLN